MSRYGFKAPEEQAAYSCGCAGYHLCEEAQGLTRVLEHHWQDWYTWEGNYPPDGGTDEHAVIVHGADKGMTKAEYNARREQARTAWYAHYAANANSAPVRAAITVPIGRSYSDTRLQDVKAIVKLCRKNGGEVTIDLGQTEEMQQVLSQHHEDPFDDSPSAGWFSPASLLGRENYQAWRSHLLTKYRGEGSE